MKITLEKGQNLFFTSDTHYMHTNICRGVSNWGPDSRTRDFDTLDHMNSTIVDNINHMVGEDDILFHVGDWSFGGFENIEEFRNRIVCKNIHLLLGNHDHHIERDKGGIQRLFKSVNNYLRLEVSWQGTDKVIKRTFILCHYPIASWHDMNRGVLHLHGHVHLEPHLRIAEGKAMDVGVDGNDLEPLSLRKVLTLLDNRPVRTLSLPSDHHSHLNT
jgi:calcineurin-like phosphoesterase family protein